MPFYIYEHPKTKKIKEVMQGMNEVHEYVDDKGVKWNRVFTKPQAAVGTQNDPFNQQQFIDKTGANNGIVGDLWSRAEEMSHKRAAQAGGVDPVREKYLANYKKKRKGKPHPKEIQERSDKTFLI